MAIGDFSREENLRPILTSPLSKDLAEQLEQVQKAITNLQKPKRKVIATIKVYYIDKPDTTDVRIRLFMRKNETGKFQQLVFLNYKRDEILTLLDVVNSVSARVLLNQSLCNIVQLKFLIEPFLA